MLPKDTHLTANPSIRTVPWKASPDRFLPLDFSSRVQSLGLYTFPNSLEPLSGTFTPYSIPEKYRVYKFLQFSKYSDDKEGTQPEGTFSL